MKKLIAFTLILVLITGCFAGCGGSEADKLVGTWKGTMDLSDAIAAALDAEDMGDTFQIGEFKVDAVLTFTKDGTYSLKLDEASLEAAFAGLIDDMKEGVIKLLEDQIAALGMEMTVEQLLALSGQNLDDLMQEVEAQLAEDKVVENIAAEAAREGNFRAEDGKLYTSASLEHTIDPATYERYTLQGDVLTLVELVGGDLSAEDEGLLTAVYPLVFKKAK